MKNISGMFGGLVSTDDKDFIKFAVKENESYHESNISTNTIKVEKGSEKIFSMLKL